MASAGTPTMFGWDLLHKTIKRSLKNKSDVIVALVHWYLVKNGGLLCLGVGDDRTKHADEVGSELLPDEWNDSENSYTLRYTSANDDVFILLGTVSEGTLVVNIVTSRMLTISNAAFSIDDTVMELKGPLVEIMPDIQDILERLRKELLEPIQSNPPRTIETQTTENRPATEPIPSNPLFYPPQGRFPLNDRPDLMADPMNPLRDIGRGDLDPFGRGGGMLFNPPMNPPGPLGPFAGPRVNIPPGARFDPFGPPGPNNRTGPDNDHFRPPGGFDSMFM